MPGPRKQGRVMTIHRADSSPHAWTTWPWATWPRLGDCRRSSCRRGSSRGCWSRRSLRSWFCFSCCRRRCSWWSVSGTTTASESIRRSCWTIITNWSTNPATLRLYGSTLKFAVIVWAATLFIGFNVAYFLVFHVRSGAVRAVLFLLCTIPFLTSAIIRTIAWIPFLGRNGVFNQALMDAEASPRSRSTSCCSPTSR